jgi:hypothetical protein
MFNEDSRIPEHMQGHVETAVKTLEAGPNQPIDSTNRYNIPAWLQRRFNVEISKRGNPYFTPIESRLQECIRDSGNALKEGQVRHNASDNQERAELVEDLIEKGRAYHDALKRLVGPDRHWKADQLVLWPLSDEVGYQLFATTNGEAELNEYATYLLTSDANVNNAHDVEKHDGYLKSAAFVDMAYDELGEYDALYAGINGESEYNVPAIVRKGYQSSANMMGRKYLQGNTGSAPATSDGDNKDALAELQSRRRISA